MRNRNFDPLAYIEKAFLDKESPAASGGDANAVSFPVFRDYIPNPGVNVPESDKVPRKYRKTLLSAPRPRRSATQPGDLDPDLEVIWRQLPKSVAFLVSSFTDDVTKNSYRGEFKESREDLVRRLLDPQLNMEETSRLLGVCPATVRRYTNRGWLSYHRTPGGQRRFRLSDVVRFVDKHGRLPEPDSGNSTA